MTGLAIMGMMTFNSSISFAAEDAEQAVPMHNEYRDALEGEGEIPAEEGESVIAEEFSNMEEPVTRMISNMQPSHSWLSSTSVKVNMNAHSLAQTKSMKSTITLQKKDKSTGKYVTVSGMTRTKTVSGSSIYHSVTYSVQSGQKYRARCNVNDGSSTQTVLEYL